MGWDIVGEKLVDLLKIVFVRKKPSDAIKDSIKIRIQANELVYSGLSIDCFFIVMVHNSGGKLKPHNFKFWSIIDGFFDEVTLPKFKYDNYQNTNMDLEFAQLAARIYEKKEVSIRTSELPVDNLRTSYEYEGLEYIRFYYLKQDRNAMWFIMVGTAAEDESLESVHQRRKIFLAVNNVKNIIRGY
jgi:hypothetical protein